MALAACVAGLASRPGPDERLAAAAQHFLGSLRPALHERAALAFEDAARTDWHFVPRDRAGVTLKEMNDEERRAAHALLRATLSTRGYLKADAVMQLDAVLREMAREAGREDPSRDPERYFIAVYGKPSSDRPWGWRIEGHHLSLNFTGAGGEEFAVAPAFLGANPAEVLHGPHAGLRVLAAEEDLARELLASLDAAQRKAAIISDQAPREVLLLPGRAVSSIGEAVGLAAAEMRADQRAMLSRLIEEYAHNLEHDLAHQQLDRITAAGIEKVRFAWAGSDVRGQPHYYRLHGPTFVIEYDNTQDGANHVHTVWRDVERDFGADLLRRHYEHDHGGR